MNVSLEEIARRAGVGIGTLYRHFPSREAVVEAVYRHEVEQLAAAVPQLIESWAPAEALHKWMHLFVDYIATKRLIAPSLGPLVGRSPALYASSAELITGAISTLVKRAVASGEVRKDIDPSDLLRAMIGVSYQNPDAGWEASARRLIDLLMDGLRVISTPVRVVASGLAMLKSKRIRVPAEFDPADLLAKGRVKQRK
jgi:AcrR family transcriptional regulator